MNIYWLQPFWFNEVYHNDLTDHKHYLSIDLDQVNIYATIGLTIFSPGFDLDNKVAGLAACGVKSYVYIDKEGKKQKKTFDHWQSHLYVENCTNILFAFAVRKAWAKAEGMIYYYN